MKLDYPLICIGRQVTKIGLIFSTDLLEVLPGAFPVTRIS